MDFAGSTNQVFNSHTEMLEAAKICATEIASKPPIAIWGTKQAVHYARDHSVEDSLRQMGWLQAGIWSNQHVKEAITALKEKRVGQFPDLAEMKYFTDSVRDAE